MAYGIAESTDAERSASGDRELLADSWSQLALAEMAKLPLEVHVMGTFTLDGEFPGPQRGRKALVKFYGELVSVRGMFVTEERGALNDRLHYHAILRVDENHWRTYQGTKLHEAWGQGFTSFTEVQGIGAFKYVTKYLIKDINGATSWFAVWKDSQKDAQGVLL